MGNTKRIPEILDREILGLFRGVEELERLGFRHQAGCREIVDIQSLLQELFIGFWYGVRKHLVGDGLQSQGAKTVPAGNGCWREINPTVLQVRDASRTSGKISHVDNFKAKLPRHHRDLAVRQRTARGVPHRADEILGELFQVTAVVVQLSHVVAKLGVRATRFFRGCES